MAKGPADREREWWVFLVFGGVLALGILTSFWFNVPSFGALFAPIVVICGFNAGFLYARRLQRLNRKSSWVGFANLYDY